MNPFELTGTITALANALSCELTINELNLLASILSQLGDTLATISAQRTLCQATESSEDTSVKSESEIYGR